MCEVFFSFFVHITNCASCCIANVHVAVAAKITVHEGCIGDGQKKKEVVYLKY